MTDTQRRTLRTLVQAVVAALVAFGVLGADEGDALAGAIVALLTAVFTFVAGKVEDRTGRSVSGPRKDEP